MSDTASEAPENSAYTIGAILRGAREANGETIEDVARMLRINWRHLQALEDGEFHKLPGTVYAIGFIRTYADHLGMDSANLIDQYKAVSSASPTKTSLEFPEPIPEGGLPGGAILFAGIVVAILAYGGWYLATEEDSFLARMVSPVPEHLAEEEQETTGTETVPQPATVEETEVVEMEEPQSEEVVGETVAEATEETTDDVADVSQMTEEQEPVAEAVDETAEVTEEAVQSVEETAEQMAGETTVEAETEAVGEHVAEIAEGVEEQTAEPVEEPVHEITHQTVEAAVEDAVDHDADVPTPETEQAALSETATISEEETDTQVDTQADTQEADTQALNEAQLQAVQETLSGSDTATVAEPEPETIAEPEPEPEIVEETVEDVVEDVTAAAEEEVAVEIAAEVSEQQAGEQTDQQDSDVAPTASTDSEDTQMAAVPAEEPVAETATGRIYGDQDNARIIVRAKSNSWIQVRNDNSGELLLTRLLRAGDEYHVPDQSGLSLLTGNAGALEILVDGEAVPSLGASGDVRRNVALDADRLKSGDAAN